MDEYNRMFKIRKRFESLGIKSPKSARRLSNEYIADMSQAKKIRLLDFGCGEGSFDVKSENIKYYGYDIDKKNKFADFHNLKEMEKMKFDVAVLSHVIEHLTPEETEGVLAWLSNHVKEIFISTPLSNYFNFGGFFSDITHKRPYSNMDTLFLIEKYFRVKRFYRCGIHTLNPLKLLVRFFLAYIFDSTAYTEFVVIASKS